MCQRPRFVAAEGGVGGAAADCGRLDVEGGELGDPWLLAAISSLTLTPRFLDRVVPPDQTFDPATYCGLFRYSADCVATEMLQPVRLYALHSCQKSCRFSLYVQPL
jgi:hypothetical protein